jgi:hypothetical protein
MEEIVRIVFNTTILIGYVVFIVFLIRTNKNEEEK